MIPLLKEIRHNPLLWLLAFVPVVFAAHKLTSEAHTLLFVLSVLAIVPLAVLLSHATESVAAKTGDAVGGLLAGEPEIGAEPAELGPDQHPLDRRAAPVRPELGHDLTPPPEL